MVQFWETRVKAIALASLSLVSMSALAAAQEFSVDEVWEPSSFSKVLASPTPEFEPSSLQRSISAEPLIEELPATFSFGPTAGYLNARGADRGTWFGGVQARLHFLDCLAAEASITFHQNRYEGGDVVVTQYPVQLTAFFYIIPQGPVRPYILGGVGWNYTNMHYSGLFRPSMTGRKTSSANISAGESN